MGKKEELTKDARKAHAAYMREWRKNNPERDKATQARYWNKKGAELKAEREKTTEKELEQILFYWNNSDEYGKEILLRSEGAKILRLVKRQDIAEEDFQKVREGAAQRFNND